MKKKIDWSTVTVSGVDTRDYPDFCDTFFEEGCWDDGTPLTDVELDQLGERNPDVLHEMATESCY